MSTKLFFFDKIGHFKNMTKNMYILHLLVLSLAFSLWNLLLYNNKDIRTT